MIRKNENIDEIMENNLFPDYIASEIAMRGEIAMPSYNSCFSEMHVLPNAFTPIENYTQTEKAERIEEVKEAVKTEVSKETAEIASIMPAYQPA